MTDIEEILKFPGVPQRKTRPLSEAELRKYGYIGPAALAVDKSLEYERKRAASVVYFLRCGDFVKIGHSHNPKKRIEKIQVWSPHDCQIIGTAAGGPTLEKKLHKDFAADRHRGEWFRLTERLQAEIDRLCGPGDASS